jgi:hypothetical protein
MDLKTRAVEMPFPIWASHALLVHIKILKLFVFYLLITSQHSLPSPHCVRFVLHVYLVMEGSTPSNCQRPTGRGCQLCKKVLIKYVMYDPHDYILEDL